MANAISNVKQDGPEEAMPSWLDYRFLTGQADAARHRENPTQSATDYFKTCDQEIAAWAGRRIPIYLDQKYWIYIRDVRLGKLSGVYADIEAMLRALVKTGRYFCPISYDIAMETFKQEDRNTRLLTAEIVDELSCNVAIHSVQHRRRSELTRVLAAVLMTNPDCNSDPVIIDKFRSQNVWTHPANFLESCR